MGNIALVIFLGLFGFLNLVHPNIPSWVLGAVALAAAVIIGLCGATGTARRKRA